MEKNSEAMVYADERRSRYCAVRLIGRAGYQHAGSRRRSALQDVVWHCSSAAPLKHRRTAKKPAVHKVRPASTPRKDSQVSGFMALLSDHAYLSKSNYRRSSLPMDYRWLAGMTPKLYSNVKRRRSITNQQETADVHLGIADFDKTSLQNSTDLSSCKVVLDKELDHYNKSQSLLTHLTSDSCQSAGIQSSHYSNEKLTCPQSVAMSFGEPSEKLVADRSYVLVNDSSDPNCFLLTPLVPASMARCSKSLLIAHEKSRSKAAKQHLDKQTASIITHSDIDKTGRDVEDACMMLSDAPHVMYEGAVCCLSSCDCFCFCDSSLSEHVIGSLPTNDVAVNGLVSYAGYIGCRGSHKVVCDLHFVGALETVSDHLEPAACIVDGQSALTADNYKQEEFVDNICIDCGCELTCDDMIECAYSVPICALCSLVANHGTPSVDDSVMADHSYARISTDFLVCPSPLKGTPASSYVVSEQPKVAEIDVIDDITFLSFTSKLLMHKYILTQRNSCDPAAKSSWSELARCERSWHAGHKPHQRAWFGSVRHRHINRFNAYNRLNEQIELGLIKPVSVQNSADLQGIRLKPSVSQNEPNKTVVGQKYKKRHVPTNLQIQRPTRMAARGQHYCLTRYRRKVNASKALLEAEQLDTMKLTPQQAEEALKLLHIPSLITRNSCSQSGILVLFL